MNSRNILSAFHILPTALCLLAGPLSAETSGLFTYTTDGTSVTITGYPADAIGKVNIPAKIAGKPVIAIGNEAFNNQTGITGVTFPSSITSIANFAFGACSALTGLQLPPNLRTIGDHAFYNGSGLTELALPASLTTIGDSAFYGCGSLTTVEIPAMVNGIAVNSFGSCWGLTSITVDAANPSYTSKDGVLFNKKKTILIQYPGGRTGSYVIPSGVRIIQAQAFEYCTLITGVTLPESVTEIGTNAFWACVSLPSIRIPGKVLTIGTTALGNSYALKSITVDSSNPNFASLDGVLFNKDKTVLLQYPCGLVGEYEIPASVTEIAPYSFYTNIGLTMVKIPNGVTRIGELAFAAISTLTQVTLPNSLTTIGYYAFSQCSELTNLIIPAKVAEIQFSAFNYCSNLERVLFLGNAPVMGTGVFEYSAAVFKIRFIKGNTGFDNPTWLGYPCAGLVGTTEVEVRQPVGTILVDGSSLSNFGQLAVGMTGKTKYYTIRNVGTADLTNLKVSINGANKANFILVAPSKTSIPPNTSVTFEVSFKPNFAVTRTSTLRIVSNDEDENPFDITLTGMGVAP